MFLRCVVSDMTDSEQTKIVNAACVSHTQVHVPQVEMLKGAVVLTGQERPEGMSKGFREDLFKKMASADGIFGRLPYQILTRTIKLQGWKRMELNRPLRLGVTHANILYCGSVLCMCPKL